MNGEHPNTREAPSTDPIPVPAQGSLHTPGPWRWEINMKSRCVRLTGGARPQYDLTVMDFVRWGMGSAAPRFIDSMQLLDRADTYSVVVAGREHHAAWFQGLNHPDAHLIAAAPDMLAALKYASDRLLALGYCLESVEAAIVKAQGHS